MAGRKPNKTYYFSVEGETEQWYLEWLQRAINNCEKTHHNVSFRCKVQKNPLDYVKSLNVLSKTPIYHLSDYESAEDVHVKNFFETIDNMRKAEDQKQVSYTFCYSNFTFDLWIILHKADSRACVSHRSQYISQINHAYDVSYRDMDEYKHETNFKSLLATCTLEDVVKAIERAKNIQAYHVEVGHTIKQYKKVEYYEENPSLMVWQAIEKILSDCGYLHKSKASSSH